ncbi:MAG TPA: phosphonate ABC transporter, permease protein PhnE [Syntrophales bacterium]|nr:phosphonate ABC transporter, permease protein PhnE [Syntrophobacterales bacterium]HQL91601.1 phosphonate ABC transporter, permease protein PhnE [Syntrophales bacterium]
MSLAELKRKTNPFSAFNLVIALSALVIVTWSWQSTQMSVSALLEGWRNMLVYIGGNPDLADSGFFPPSLKGPSLNRYLVSMLETVQMAFLALILSVVIAFPLAFLASRNTLEIMIPGRRLASQVLRKALYTAIRFFANLSRSINELVWALLFVSAVGLGPMPGILALGVHTSGVLIKLFSEGIENVQPEPVTALMATGAGPVKVIRYGVIPQITPFFVSMTLYRFESDVRSATILGFTGAGGIGVYLYDKLRSYENQDVTTILIVIVITVAIVDRLSAVIRKRYT